MAEWTSLSDIGRISFSDIPNWRAREVMGQIAPGRQQRLQESRLDTDYSRLPLSENIDDRRARYDWLIGLLSNLTMDDPLAGEIYQAIRDGSLTPPMRPLRLPLPSPLGEQAGASALTEGGLIGLSRNDLREFESGRTPGGPFGEEPLRRLVDLRRR